MKTMLQAKQFYLGTFIFAILIAPVTGIAQENKPAQNKAWKADSANYYIDKGNMLRQMRKFEDALNAYENARTFQPASEDAIIGVMAANFELNRMDNGLKVLNEWVKLEPENTKAWLYMAMSEAETNHPEEALNAFNNLVKLVPDSAGYRVGQIQCLISLKRWEESIKACDILIPKSPQQGPLVWSCKAYSLAMLGKYDEAFAVFDKAMKLYPNSMELIYNRGCVYALKGDKANALADLKKAIDLEPMMKERAPKDQDFKSLYEDEDFKKLTAGAAAPGKQAKFEVSTLTDAQKYQRLLNQAESNNVLMISYAKSQGKTAEDVGAYVAEQVKANWNKEMGFEGYVNTMLYLWASFNPDGTIMIQEQSDGKIVFKAPSVNKQLKMAGPIMNVNYDEYLNFLRIRYGKVAEYLGASISLNDSADGLTVTIAKVQ